MAYKSKHTESAAEWNRKNPEKHAEHVKKWEAKNPEKRRAYQKAWRSKNVEKMRVYHAGRHRRIRLEKQGWTESAIEDAFKQQDGRCWLCQIPLTRDGKRGPAGICADHNHETGTRRGLICHRCNVVEGLLLGIGIAPLEWATRLQTYFDTFDNRPSEGIGGENLKE